MEDILLTLLIAALMAYWTFKIAEKNGRDKGWAILWGLFGGLITVIIYAILGPTKEVKLQRAKELVEKSK